MGPLNGLYIPIEPIELLIGKGIMFPGMFMRKPDKAAALKQLKSHVAMFGAWVVVIRVTPYVLHFLSGEKEELKLEL
ncbi:Translocase of outer membrane subunit-like protein [Vigna angularis]|uniref:Translocase of outer membrane subunit-like protein n=3 Tax=Vigna TaxID=3913 RepID=A0A8T0KF69_PHAAN|nr:Translocase of outer membrane subunit-like protein [Vigna angularis]